MCKKAKDSGQIKQYGLGTVMHNIQKGPLCSLQTMKAQIDLCMHAQVDLGLHCLLTDSMDTVVCQGTENVQIRLHRCTC